MYDSIKEKLVTAYGQLRIGNPLDEKNHVGPLIDKDAVKMYWKQSKNVRRKEEIL